MLKCLQSMPTPLQSAVDRGRAINYRRSSPPIGVQTIARTLDCSLQQGAVPLARVNARISIGGVVASPKPLPDSLRAGAGFGSSRTKRKYYGDHPRSPFALQCFLQEIL
jgi:hypothetical protein